MTKSKLLHSAAVLFLEKGYQQTTVAEISRHAGVSGSALFRVFNDKEAIIHSLIQYVYDAQFQITEKLLSDNYDSILFYGIETALQFYIAESSENLRDLYLTAYSLPSTTEYIYKKTAVKLEEIFGQRLPELTTAEFYEYEIATGGMVRSYMSYKCDMYFTIKRKITRYLESALRVFKISEEEINSVIEKVTKMDLKKVALQVIENIVERADKGLL